MGLLGSIAATAQQKIGNNPGTLNPGAILELESTNRGFLLPRISLTSLSTWGLNGTGTDGMMVYNTNTTTGAGYYVWSGGAWNRIFTGTVAATTNALSYNAGALTSTVNGVGASATIPTANTTTLGLLSAADWNTFNGKQNALTVSNGLTLTGSALTLGGALTTPTTLTLGTQSLTFNASGTAQVIIQGPAGNTAGLRLSNLTGAGTAGTSGQKVLSVNASGDVVLVTDFGSNNAGTVTNVTGTAPITVTNGTTAPVIGINQAALDLALMGGILPVTKLAAGTTGQTLQMVGTTPTWVTPSVTNTSNIYTADGTLTGARTVTQGTNNLSFAGTGKTIMGSLGVNSLQHAGRFSAVTSSNSLPQLTIMNDSTSRIGNTATIAFRTQGTAALLGNTASITALQTGGGSETSLLFGTYNGGLGIIERMRIAANGSVSINNLSGTGSRMVVADANGVLSTQAVPVASVTGAANGLSLVTGNVELGGSLTKATTLTLGTNALTFDASGAAQLIVNGPAGNTAGLRLSNLTGAGTAGTSGQKVLSVNASGDVVLVTDFGTANAGTVTNVTGSGLIAVANGSTTPAVSLVPGTTGQVLQMVGTTPTWVTPSVTNTSNIYTADGTLTGARVVTQGANNLTFSGSGQLNKYSGSASSPATFYLGRTETEGEFGVAGAAGQGFVGSTVGDVWLKSNLATGNLFVGTTAATNLRLMTSNAERMTVTSTGLVGIGTNTPTSTLDVNGSVSFAIRKITQTGATRALGLAAAARTVGATDRTVLVNTSVNPEGIEIILPNPVLASGREYVIRKMDDSSNPVLFSYAVSGAIPAVTAGGNAILVSEGTTNQFVGSMNFVKTLRIQSNGTNWILID